MARSAREPARRLVDVLLGIALTLAVIAPMIFGPALAPLTRALGGIDDHVCACGMTRGTCGCPECEKLEQNRLREHAPHPYAVLRARCAGDEVAPGLAALPPSLARAEGVLAPAAPHSLAPAAWPDKVVSQALAEPVTPPPRRAAS
jgi:hypothetical protein